MKKFIAIVFILIGILLAVFFIFNSSQRKLSESEKEKALTKLEKLINDGENILKTKDEKFRVWGLSRAKTLYVKDLAARVKDGRLNKLAEIEKSMRVVPAIVEFVDIAGLVRGAHKGEGLGNQFLSHIKETSIIVHLVRSFIDDNVTHVEKSIDPERDIETIELELILKDLEVVGSMLPKLERR